MRQCAEAVTRAQAHKNLPGEGFSPTPPFTLVRVVAMRDGPLTGLTLIDAILARGLLEDYYLAHSARADLCRRLGKTAEARASYEKALSLARPEPGRRFLARRLNELTR